MKIIDLTSENSRAVEQTAIMLMDGFRDTGSTSWRNIDDALAEVSESFQPNRISRIAVDEAGNVQGWIGGLEEYEGNVWELHPLVVRRDCRKCGVGRALVLDFENQVAQRGGHTIRLGTDDENDRTSIGGIDLYPDVLDKLRAIQNLRQHPFEFYRKLGFEIVGVIPDANGFGKPDILMAKRIKNPAKPDNAESDDMLPEYNFDYSKAKPNRFAERAEKNRRSASNKSDRKAALLKHAGAIESQFTDTSLKVDELVYGK